MRIAIIYDCLYPHTVGGAERWYRSLAERMSGRHDVTYLTRRQWDRGEDPGTSFSVSAVSGSSGLYTKSGRRRILPPLRFGAGVFWHLLRRAGQYDAVHCASFPYFPLIGAWLALRLRGRRRLIVDWHEVWILEYWKEYLGPVCGRIGYAVQRLCISLPDESFTFSRLHERRLLEEGLRTPLTRLTGEYEPEQGSPRGPQQEARTERTPTVVFAGRHIPEKRVTLVPEAIAHARRRMPIRGIVFGDGPERAMVESRIGALGLQDTVELAGAVEGRDVRRALDGAACLLLPSAREGYGLVVVESIARGTPVVVVDGPDNAATELIEPGINGYVAPSTDPAVIAEYLIATVEGGAELRRSTLEWYREHAPELSIDSSLHVVERAYDRAVPSARP